MCKKYIQGSNLVVTKTACVPYVTVVLEQKLVTGIVRKKDMPKLALGLIHLIAQSKNAVAQQTLFYHIALDWFALH